MVHTRYHTALIVAVAALLMAVLFSVLGSEAPPDSDTAGNDPSNREPESEVVARTYRSQRNRQRHVLLDREQIDSAESAQDILEIRMHNIPPGSTGASLLIRNRDGSRDVLRSESNPIIIANPGQIVSADVSADNCVSVHIRITDEAINEGHIDIELVPSTIIVAIVKDNHGYLLPGRSVGAIQIESYAEHQGGSHYRYLPVAESVTDDRGRCVLTNLMPGEYRVSTGEFAEWSGAEARVTASGQNGNHVVLNTPKRPHSTYAGLYIESNAFPEIGAHNSRLWRLRIEGAIYDVVYLIRERCAHAIVPGKQGQVFTGQIIETTSAGKPVVGGKISETINLTVGADIVMDDIEWIQ